MGQIYNKIYSYNHSNNKAYLNNKITTNLEYLENCILNMKLKEEKDNNYKK